MKTNAKIYVMQADDGTLKLGHSKSPATRAKQLGRRVAIVHETDVLEHAEQIERLAHRVLALHGKHLRGEWFEADLSDAIKAIEIATRQAEAEELPLGRAIGPNARTGTKTMIGIKIDNELLERLDRYQSSLPYQTTRTALVEAAIEQMLDREARVVDLARRRK